MLSPWFFNLVRKVVQPGREQTVAAWLIGQRDVELGKYCKRLRCLRLACVPRCGFESDMAHWQRRMK